MLSSGFIYYLPILSRSYALIPVLVFLAAILYSRQKQYPILYSIVLSCIATTHVIMFFFSFLLFIDFLYNNVLKNIKEKLPVDRIYFFASSLVFVSLFYVVLLAYDALFANQTFNNHIDFVVIIQKVKSVFYSFFINYYNNSIWLDNSPAPLSSLDNILLCLMVLIYLFLFVYLFKKNRKLFFIAFLSIAFQFAIYIFAYSNLVYVTRIFTAHIILFFSFWVLFSSDKSEHSYIFRSKNIINILFSIFFYLLIMGFSLILKI